MEEMYNSKYVEGSTKVVFDDETAKKFVPLLFDSKGLGKEAKLFYRILKGKETCIQYYYYWKNQDCSQYVIEDRAIVALATGFIFIIPGILLTILVYLAQFSYISSIGLFLSFIQNTIMLLLIFFLGGAIIGAIGKDFIGEIIGRFVGGNYFTHLHDFEPVFVYISENDMIEKLVVSGTGGVEYLPHRVDIYMGGLKDSREGTCDFTTNGRPFYPLGTNQGKAFYYVDNLETVEFDSTRPKIGIATCYHAFSVSEEFLNGITYEVVEPQEAGSKGDGDETEDEEPADIRNIELEQMTDEVLSDWFSSRYFGHDVSNPFEFPYIKFTPPQNLIRKRKKLMVFLWGIERFVNGFKEFLSEMKR